MTKRNYLESLDTSFAEEYSGAAGGVSAFAKFFLLVTQLGLW